MRAAVIVVVLLLIVSACVASVEDEPAVSVADVTTTAVVTTRAMTATVSAVTTTVEDGYCPLADRGYQCPPDLLVIGSARSGGLHSPGTYRTRVFEPGFEFTQPASFSGFEAEFAVTLHNVCSGESCFDLGVVSPHIASQVDLEALAADACATDSTITDAVVLGFPAMVLELRVPDDCDLNLPTEPFGHVDDGGHRIQLSKVAVSDDVEIMVSIQAPAIRFDGFLADIQPIIDSIRFLDL